MARPKKTETSANRREEILEQAARVMQSRGVISPRMQDVAAEVGIAYTAFYHYFGNRDHLLQQLYLRALQLRDANLASAEGQSGLDRLLDFIRLDLTQQSATKVSLGGAAALADDYREDIFRTRGQLERRMETLIEEGVSDGTIRSDLHVPALAKGVHAILNRFVHLDFLSPGLRRRVHPVAGLIKDQLRRGILLDRARDLAPSYVLRESEQLLCPPSGVDDEMDRFQDILRIATRHFNAHGSSASIPNIAQDLGVSKTVIYQYAADKQDLLYQCYMRGVQVIEMSHRIAGDRGRDPLDIILIHRRNLYGFHASAAGPFTLINSLEYLSPQQQRRLTIRNRAVRTLSERRFTEGIAAGQFRRDLNPEISQALLGAVFYSLPSWDFRTASLDVDTLAAEAFASLMRGIAA